ncbi:MAG: FHA domain-containing protein [Candidatus Viridilinea halotolerans]|uniref:FHA domain-containing protein n=1 Tax=Candidatus Viridilinea halotolerans TaxID=2491704 RepID=A0A426TSB1_9CHLR|nr:MAG: FHA domain-containing protein [Candidatus Viridilinea halotolerans]
MHHLFRLVTILCGLALLLTTPTLHAQPEINLRVDQVDESRFPEVQLFATVTDAQGRALTDLNADRFVLREGGRSVTLNEVAAVPPDAVELRVVLALDISGSIEPNLNQIKDTAIDFVRSLGPQDQIALVVFGNTARVVEAFTPDHGAVINHILAIGPSQLEDYTALYNGGFEAIRLAADGATTGRRAVVVMTDGKNTIAPGTDSLALTDVQRSASERRVPVHVIGVGPEISLQELRIIATNGRLIEVAQADQLAAAYEDIARQLRQQYLIRYTSELPADSATYPLELSVNSPEFGTSVTNANLRALPPIVPQLRVTLPAELVIGEPAAIDVEIIARHPPANGQLILNDQVVFESVISETIWRPAWTPLPDLAVGSYQLEVRVTDSQGTTSSSITPSLALVSVPSPEEAPSRMWLWIILGATLLLLIIGLIIFLLMRRGSADGDGAIAPLPDPTYVPPPLPPTGPGPITGPGVGFGPPVDPTRGATPMPGNNPRPGLTRGRPVDKTRLAETEALDTGQAILVVQQGPAQPKEIRLKAGREVLIGRDSRADIVVNDSKASAEHAKIRFLEGGFSIFDLKSTNGLWVNGRRIDKLQLQDGDEITVGSAHLVFKHPRAKG